MLTQDMYKKSSTLLVILLLCVAARAGAAVSDAELTRNVQRQISGLKYGALRPTITVMNGDVMIAGTVESLWLKEETIRRALKVQGVGHVLSDLMIVKAESDDALAMKVRDSIVHYDLFTVFDDFQGGVKNGVVHLSGAVTEDKKLDDVLERVAKIRGVQAIDNKVTILPANQSDDRLRVAIVNAIYSNPDLSRYSMANPPVHVIVNNGHVTLIGTLLSQDEKIKALQSARFINGVLALEDRIVVPQRR